MSLIYIARPELVSASARQLPSAPFIVGVPRTGTTLLRMMLDAHPAMSIPAETDFLADLIPVCLASSFPAELFLARIIGDPRWSDHHLDPLVFRQRIRAIQPFDIGTAVRTFYRLCGERWGKPRFGDKTPGYRNYMPMIQEVLPEARFIHILRDGRDVLLSHKLTWWAPNTLADAANLWTNEIRKTRAGSANLAYYMELRYEDLLRDTEGHLRKICTFLDLPWDDCMLHYYEWSERRLAEFSDCTRPDGKFISGDQWRGLHALTTKPPDTSRSGRWRQEMPESEQRQFEALAGDLLEEFGYERRFEPAGRRGGEEGRKGEGEKGREGEAALAVSPSPSLPFSPSSSARLVTIARPELVPVQARELPPAPFIVGMPRSGTTLLRLMLDAHPLLAIPAETDFLADEIPACRKAAQPAEHFLARVIGDSRFKDHQLDPGVLRQQILALQPFDVGAALRTFYRLCGARFGKTRFGDKTPGYRGYMALIQEVLPEARFIHIIRDGRDVAVSHKSTWWAPGSIAEAASAWAGEVQKTRNRSADLAYYMEIRYEDLLRETEACLRKICSFLDLPWDDRILSYHERSEQRLAEFNDFVGPDGRRISADARRGIQAMTTKPPDISRSGRWKTEMSESEQRIYEAGAGEVLERLGYERKFGTNASEEGEGEKRRGEGEKGRKGEAETARTLSPSPPLSLSLSRLHPFSPSLVHLARPELVPAKAQQLPPAPFIVGMPRSGTTLLRLMLDAHPALAIPSETEFLPDVIAGCRTAAQPAELFLSRVLGDHCWADHQLDADVLRRTILAIEPFEAGAALRAFYRLCGARFGKTRFGDKTPRYVLCMPLIQQALPEARFIHIIRDGRDVALSLKSTWFEAKSVAHAAGGWMHRLNKARAESPQLAYYLEIRYEDLVADTEATLRKVCAFIDLPWDDGVLNYHERSEQRLAEWADDSVRADGQFISAEQRRAIHVFTTKPPDSSRTERWKTEMPASDQREFESYAGELLERFGYERKFAAGPAQVPPAEPQPSVNGMGPVPATLIAVARPELVPVEARALAAAPFIVGVPRSGTTLLRMMLDAHPLLAIPSETDFLPEVIAGCRTSEQPAELFLGRVIGDKRWQEHQLDAEVLRREILALKPFSVSAALRIFYRLCGARWGKTRFGDKTPGYVAYMPTIQEALPEARFIHIIRDGRDVALSVKPTWFGPKTVDDAAGRWLRLLRKARADYSQLAYYLEIRYEDLLRDTEATLRRICAFIDLPWHDDVLSYHERSQRRLAELSDVVRPDGQVIAAHQWRALHALTAKPPDASRAGRWKTEMNESDQRAYEDHAGDMLSYFGYERRFLAEEEGRMADEEGEDGRKGEWEKGRGGEGEKTAHAVQRKLLFASYHCYVDPSSGAAQSARDLMPLLAARGWACRVFCGPHLDFEDGRLFRQVMNSPNFGLGAGAVVADRPCTGAAVPCSLVDFAQGDIPITVFDAPRTRSLQPPDRDEGYVFLAYFEKLLDEFRPDMMLTYGGHWAAIEMMAAAHRRGIPIVFWLHNCFYHTGEFFKPMAGVIVPSQFARQHYLAKLKLDFTELPPPLDWPGRVCDKVEGQYVTFVNPQPDKGVFVFAAIAQELHRRRPDIPFLVVEGRSKLSWLRDAGLDLDKLGNVFGMGATTDPRTFYRVSKMVLMPSLWDETFGRVASEALANGIPVLASRRGGLPEALAEAGFLFDVPARYTPQTRLVPTAQEITPWVETIIRLWDDRAFYEKEQQRCRAAARVWAPEKVAETYDDYLNRLLMQSRQKAIGVATGRPAISVVMPVHNGVDYLERAVRSVQQQSFPLWELLAVDDGSTDASHELLQRLARQDPRIRVFRLPENRGPAAARNHALTQARGDMICYLDCDDEYYPNNLERIWTRHGEAEVLIYGYHLVNEKPGSPDFGARTTYDPRPYQDNLLQKRHNMVVGLGVSHRRALLERTGLFNESLHYEEDWDLWKRFVDAGASFSFIEHCSGLYHTRGDSLSRTRRVPSRKPAGSSDRGVIEAASSAASVTAPVFVLSAGGVGDAAIIEQWLLASRQVFLWSEQRGIIVHNLLRIVEDMRGLLSWPANGYREKSLENGDDALSPAVHPDLAAIQDGCREFLERTLGLTARARGYPRWGMKESCLGRDAALFLQELFPEARFILLVRDPATSLQALKSTASYSRDFAADPAAFLQSWARISQEFVAVQGDLRQALLLRHEDLLADPQQAQQAISALSGIPAKLLGGAALDRPPLPALDDADWQALRDPSVQAVAEKLGYEVREPALTSP